MGKTNFGDIVKSIDIYGNPIGINYKGKSVYNTYCGTFLTLITCALMSYYIGVKFILLQSKTNPTTTFNKGIIKDFNIEIAEKVNGQVGNFVMNADKLSFGVAFIF
jgi:hypothetical protein